MGFFSGPMTVKKLLIVIGVIFLIVALVVGVLIFRMNTQSAPSTDLPIQDQEVVTDIEDEDNSDIELEDKPAVNETKKPVIVNAGNSKPKDNVVSDATIHFLDTGDSDAILIVEGRDAVLVDGADADDGEYIVNYIRDLGINRLKYVVVTHGHKDNIGGLPYIFDNLGVDYIFMMDNTLNDPEAKDFKQYIERKRLIHYEPVEERIYNLGESYFKVFNTEGGSTTDNSSLIILYTNGNDKVLLMGDAKFEVEEKLLNKLPAVNVLKVGYHGLDEATSEKLLDSVTPQYAVVLAKDIALSEGVKQRLTSRSIDIYRTGDHGTIIFTSTGKGFKDPQKKVRRG